MKRIHIVVSITTCLIFSFFLLGCGGSGPGSPGSCGSEDTGLIVQINTVSHSDPAGDQGDMWQIDLYQSDCGGDPEEWGDDYANVTFAGIPIYTGATTNLLYITHYRVIYTPLSPEYPPIDELRGGAQGALFTTGALISGPYPFLILDIGRKYELQDVIARGVYPSNFPLLYDISVEFFGQDQYGNDFCVGPLIRVVEIGPYDKC